MRLNDDQHAQFVRMPRYDNPADPKQMTGMLTVFCDRQAPDRLVILDEATLEEKVITLTMTEALAVSSAVTGYFYEQLRRQG